MPFSKPQILIPVLHPEASLEALEHLLSPEQIQLIMRLDRRSSVKDLAQLTSRSLTDVTDDIKELTIQGVLQLFQRTTKGGPLHRVMWPPPAEEWLELPGISDPLGNTTDTEPEVYTISSMELHAVPFPPEPPKTNEG